MSIRSDDHHFPRAGISEKLLAGPNSPSAGPTFPRLDAATPMADSKSNVEGRGILVIGLIAVLVAGCMC